MFDVSLLKGMLIIWAIVTGVMTVLLIYRSTLGAHEQDQLYLTKGEAMIEEEQKNILKKERKLAPFLYVLGTVSVVLLLSIVGVWLYQGLLMT